MTRLFLASLLALTYGPTAFADEPDKPADSLTQSDRLSDKIDDKLSEHRVTIAKSMARVKRNLDKNTDAANGDFSEEVEAVAEALEQVFADQGLMRDLTAMLSDFASDVDVETEDGATVLTFDGLTIGKIARTKSRDSEDGLTISGMGQTLTLDRETVVEDGQSRTRIVIEMDSDEE